MPFQAQACNAEHCWPAEAQLHQSASLHRLEFPGCHPPGASAGRGTWAQSPSHPALHSPAASTSAPPPLPPLQQQQPLCRLQLARAAALRWGRQPLLQPPFLVARARCTSATAAVSLPGGAACACARTMTISSRGSGLVRMLDVTAQGLGCVGRLSWVAALKAAAVRAVMHRSIATAGQAVWRPLTMNHARQCTPCAPEANAGTSRPVQASMSPTCSAPLMPEKNATGGVPAGHQHQHQRQLLQVGVHGAHHLGKPCRCLEAESPPAGGASHGRSGRADVAAPSVLPSASLRVTLASMLPGRAPPQSQVPSVGTQDRTAAQSRSEKHEQQAPGAKGCRRPPVGKVAGLHLLWHCNQHVDQEVENLCATQSVLPKSTAIGDRDMANAHPPAARPRACRRLASKPQLHAALATLPCSACRRVPRGTVVPRERHSQGEGQTPLVGRQHRCCPAHGLSAQMVAGNAVGCCAGDASVAERRRQQGGAVAVTACFCSELSWRGGPPQHNCVPGLAEFNRPSCSIRRDAPCSPTWCRPTSPTRGACC